MASARFLHPQVDVDLEYVEEDISNRRYRSNANDRKLWPRETISDVWPGEPPGNDLHVFVSLPSGECVIRLFASAQTLSATAQSASPSARNRRHNSAHDKVPKHKKEFEDFHTSNGVRTITGSIGPVKNGMRTTISSECRPDYGIQCACCSRLDIVMCMCPESLP